MTHARHSDWAKPSWSLGIVQVTLVIVTVAAATAAAPSPATTAPASASSSPSVTAIAVGSGAFGKIGVDDDADRVLPGSELLPASGLFALIFFC